MKMTTLFAMGLVTLVAGGVAVADPKSSGGAPAGATAMPRPSAELAAWMKPLEGTLRCDSTMPAGAMGPAEIKTKSTVKFKSEDGGYFWHGTATVDKTKDTPGMIADFWLGMDAAGEMTANGHDSLGNSWMLAGKPSGDTVVMTGDGFMMGQKVKIRETMSQKGTHKIEVDMGKGFQNMGTDDCKK